MELQRPVQCQKSNSLKEELIHKHQSGESYRKISIYLNNIISEEIERDFETIEIIKKTKRDLDKISTTIDFLQYQKKYCFDDSSLSPSSEAKKILKEFSLGNDLIELIFSKAIKSIKKNEEPFFDDWPISKRMVRDLLRQKM